MLDKTTKDVIKNMKKEENSRFNLPKVKLSEFEKDILIAIAEGRSTKEINSAIKFYDKNISFHNIICRILNKLEAFTIPHAVTKAILLNKINIDKFMK